MIVLNYAILALWIGSFGGIVFIIVKKAPALMALSEESLTFKETFFEFLKRKKEELLSQLKKAEINLLTITNKILLKFKIMSLRSYNKTHDWTEALNNRLHHRKKKMEEIIKKKEEMAEEKNENIL